MFISEWFNKKHTAAEYLLCGVFFIGDKLCDRIILYNDIICGNI